MIAHVLAQASAPTVPEVDHEAVQNWIDQASQRLVELPGMIDRIDLLVAVLLIPAGVLSLLYGFRIIKGMVVIYSSVGGAACGWWLVTEVLGRPEHWWAGLLAGGLIMAALAWPLVNVFVGLYGAAAGGVAGYAVAQAFGGGQAMLLGAAVGVVLGAILAAVVFRFMIVLTTSVLGAHMAVVGAVALLYRAEEVSSPLKTAFAERPYLLPVAVAVPALIGVAYQLYRSEGRESKEDAKKKDGE